MALNDQLVTQLITRVTRELDLGDYTESLRGSVVQIVVNAPTILEQFSAEMQALPDGDVRRNAQRRKVLALLLDQPLDRAAQLDDMLASWLFAKGMALYNAYHDDLLKKAVPG